MPKFKLQKREEPEYNDEDVVDDLVGLDLDPFSNNALKDDPDFAKDLQKRLSQSLGKEWQESHEGQIISQETIQYTTTAAAKDIPRNELPSKWTKESVAVCKGRLIEVAVKTTHEYVDNRARGDVEKGIDFLQTKLKKAEAKGDAKKIWKLKAALQVLKFARDKLPAEPSLMSAEQIRTSKRLVGKEHKAGLLDKSKVEGSKKTRSSILKL